MNLTQAVETLRAIEKKLHVFSHAMSVLTVDGATAAPKKSAAGRGDTMAALSGMSYDTLISDATREAFDTILADPQADERIRREAELVKESYDELTRIPVDEYMAYQKLLAESDAVWHEAKLKSDFAAFAPYLEKVFACQSRLAELKKPGAPIYDTLLDNYEKGASVAMLDPFFRLLREKLTPVIAEVASRPAPRTDFLHACYPVEQQRAFSLRLMDLIGIDRDRCSIAETEHPFTDGVNRDDVRITTHYHEDDVSLSMYSVIHEGGHALYELGSDPAFEGTVLAGGVSMGIHESQSRFYENIIGRSLPFCAALLPVMKDCFPEQMKGVTEEELYRAVNLARPSLIRTEADELTYSMHVMIRYELEKALLDGSLAVKDLPGEWNRMYKTYLGVDVPDDRRGVLQDSHWSTGLVGYFPSYALGSAYGVQMLHAMQKDVDVWGTVQKGDLKPVGAWLDEKIHRFGSLLTPKQVFEHAVGAPFDPNEYIAYLTEKYLAM